MPDHIQVDPRLHQVIFQHLGIVAPTHRVHQVGIHAIRSRNSRRIGDHSADLVFQEFQNGLVPKIREMIHLIIFIDAARPDHNDRLFLIHQPINLTIFSASTSSPKPLASSITLK